MSNDGDPGGAKSRTVDGRYRLLERIGSGGMGTVWRARDELIGREVAVKQPRLSGDPEGDSYRRAAHRLHREARAAARVDHPCAVSIHDVVVEEGADADGGLPWIVMELVRGESLHEVLRRGPLDPAETARIGLAVLGALRAAHAVGIVHRDVKPANVLLGPHGRVVLTDFGIAHIQGEESLTASGEFVGSLEFIAPERMSGRGAGPASDLWSLGVLLYAAVEGWSPFRRTTLESTLAAILAADPPEPKQAGPLGPLLVRLLQRDPERRPDPAEAAAALAAVAEGAEGVAAGMDRAHGAAEAEPQDVRVLREFGEDVGTVRVGGAPPVDHPEPEPPPTRDTRVRRPFHRRPVALAPALAPALALVVGLLAGGGWLGASLWETGARSSPWVVHREAGMDASLTLPSLYLESARQGAADQQPRLVIYSAGSVDVRLTLWDRAPGTPLARAVEAHETWKGYAQDARTQSTRTTFHGFEAVLADTTYGLDVTPTRVLQLFVLTADSRMYELRVDMPKGTPDEKQGTAVFEEARDRLEIAVG
ncbi:serine/threonine-protein kinase [Streptomyces sp. NPDC006872]|uniref:serine/threonine-protein kinase n=1 Tax=Streptomyces sp. NPDC006872 TaxID=3155720 RepID=UPI0033D09AA5